MIHERVCFAVVSNLQFFVQKVTLLSGTVTFWRLV